MPVVYVQDKNYKWVKYNFWIALIMLTFKKRWSCVQFLIEYCDSTEIKIPYAKQED